MSNQYQKLILIENDEIFNSEGLIVSWSSFQVSEGIISLPQLVDQGAEKLRQEYLDWVYQLSDFFHQNNKIKQATTLENGFSLWWSGLIQEKSVYKSLEIY